MNEQDYNNTMQVNLTLRQAFKLMGEDYTRDAVVKLVGNKDRKKVIIASVRACLEEWDMQGISVYGIRAWFANEEFKGYKYYVDDDVLDKGWIE